MDIKTCYLTGNDCYKRNAAKADSRYTTFQRRGPLGVMVHSTGANNPTLRRYLAPDDGVIGQNAYNNHWNKAGLDVCVHAFIGLDKNGIVRCYQTLPWNFRGWHCGGAGNDTHVSFEICEDGLRDRDYFLATYRMAVSLTADICKQYDLDPLADGVVLDHAEGSRRGIASAHSDVSHWWSRFGVTMDDFRRAVAAALEAPEALYRVRKTWADAQSQLGAFASLDNAKAACPAGYTVYDKDGKAVYTNNEEDIDMTQTELKIMIQDAADKAVVDAIGRHYNTVGEITSPSYRPTIDKLVASGALKGRGGEGDNRIIDMSEDIIRALVIMDRAGAFGK